MEANKLPLMVLYDSGESWYVEKDAKPIAIFLALDEIAVYVRNFDKTDYESAKLLCGEMEDENLFWCLPTQQQLQVLLDKIDDFNKVAELIGVEPIKKAKYWSRKSCRNGVRIGVNFGLEKEVEISECEYAFVRPFLRM